VLADIKTFSALGAYGCAVICALTAQNTRAVTGIEGVSTDFIRLQIDTLFDDVRIDSAKLGMLGTAAIARTVADALGPLLASGQLPALVVYFISGVAETNRHPFDVVEGESEIVAGHMVEYAGMSFAVFFLAEYANMILVSALAAIMFFGGWQPFFTLGLDIGPQWLWDWFWLFIKTFFLVSLFIWFRASFPRYRYDQIMRLGWKVFIPVTLVWLLVIAVWMQTPFNIWKS